MITVTRNIEDIAVLYNVGPESVAIRTGATYRRHLVIKGSSLCGRVNNDGYDLDTMFPTFEGFICNTCDKKFIVKAGN
jgi:hypothetical protein